MTDIVDWLRRFKTLLITSDASKPNGVAVARIGEAADRIASDAILIERLRALPSADALEAARRILAAIAGMQGEKLAVAFEDEQTASHVSFIIENAARVSRALLQAEEKTKR